MEAVLLIIGGLAVTYVAILGLMGGSNRRQQIEEVREEIYRDRSVHGTARIATAGDVSDAGLDHPDER